MFRKIESQRKDIGHEIYLQVNISQSHPELQVCKHVFGEIKSRERK